LLPVLHHPVKPPLPLSAAMRVFGEMRGLVGIGDLDTAPEEAVLATLFELLLDLLQAGDPRLIPDLISKFWSRPLAPDPAALNAFEYFAVRASCPDSASNGDPGRRSAPVRHTIRGVMPQRTRFFFAASAQNGSRSTDLNSP
jgi:hypothetical protein